MSRRGRPSARRVGPHARAGRPRRTGGLADPAPPLIDAFETVHRRQRRTQTGRRELSLRRPSLQPPDQRAQCELDLLRRPVPARACPSVASRDPELGRPTLHAASAGNRSPQRTPARLLELATRRPPRAIADELAELAPYPLIRPARCVPGRSPPILDADATRPRLGTAEASDGIAQWFLQPWRTPGSSATRNVPRGTGVAPRRRVPRPMPGIVQQISAPRAPCPHACQLHPLANRSTAARACSGAASARGSGSPPERRTLRTMNCLTSTRLIANPASVSTQRLSTTTTATNASTSHSSGSRPPTPASRSTRACPVPAQSRRKQAHLRPGATFADMVGAEQAVRRIHARSGSRGVGCR
jgi:hypothetical protein